MVLPSSFYLKLSGVCFVVGGCMELFMIKTGFYNIVTRTEAERYLETKAEREKLRSEVQQHLLSKGIDIQLPKPKSS